LSDFSQKLIQWQKQHGRHGLPWQNTRDPYRIWLSEIMLQQTQVSTVIPYYDRFLGRFPEIRHLAEATEEEVLRHWSGLGYYSRARNLHKAAIKIQSDFGGRFPVDFEEIQSLPGIGRSTAAAISVFAFGAKQAILDGNVKRVLARCFGMEGFTGNKKIEDGLWKKAVELLPANEIEIYTQSLMDLGATLCTRSRPLCNACPVLSQCVAFATDRVAELPTPKPRKAVPVKNTRMMIIMDRGDVLLEKRPSSGIWGGLWSLPEVGEDSEPTTDCRVRFGIDGRIDGELPLLEHTFTHFRLQITPLVMGVRKRMDMAGQHAFLWLPLSEAINAAIATPVRKLLRQMAAGHQLAMSIGTNTQED
jgi:A/G-specific adenine glycosylase